MDTQRTPLNIIPYSKVKEALKDEPELFEFWKNRFDMLPEGVVPLNKQANNLSPKAIKDMAKIMKRIEEEEKEQHS